MSSCPSSQIPWSRWHNRLHIKLKKNPNLLPKEAVLLLAISGGQDSMALVQLLIDLRRIYKWELIIWHGDHGWHDKSDEFAKSLENWCQGKGLRFFCDTTNKKRTRNEAEARDWRYSCLVERAITIFKEAHCNEWPFVVTGHTGSDKAETVLFNLSRGTDLAGLSSLNECRILRENIKLIRPLLCFSRQETQQICKDLTLPILLDPSNQSNKLSRNIIRHKIIPIMEELHPGCSLRIAALSERLSKSKEEREVLKSLALKSLTINGGICRERLAEIPIETRVSLFIYYLHSIGGPSLSTKKMLELISQVEPQKRPGNRLIGQGWRITWIKNLIKVENENTK